MRKIVCLLVVICLIAFLPIQNSNAGGFYRGYGGVKAGPGYGARPFYGHTNYYRPNYGGYYPYRPPTGGGFYKGGGYYGRYQNFYNGNNRYYGGYQNFYSGGYRVYPNYQNFYGGNRYYYGGYYPRLGPKVPFVY